MYLKKIKYFPTGQLLSEEGKTALLNKQKLIICRHSQDDLKMFLRCSNMSIDVLVGLVYMGKMYFLAPGPRINSLQHEFPKKGVFVNHPISLVEIQT